MRVRRVVRHPLLVVPLVAVLLTLSWMRYEGGRESVSRADEGAELFGTAVAAIGEAETRGWTVDHSLDASVSLHAVPGRVGEHGLQVDVHRYVSGDVTLTSPRIAVDAGHDYLFKAYTSNGPAFTLLAHYYYRDGTDRLVALQDHPADRRDWSTVSAAFSSGETVSAVEFVFRMASSGTLHVDGAYLEPADDVHVEAPPADGDNLIPNPRLTVDEAGLPIAWTTYESGWSPAEFRLESDQRGRYLETQISDYQGGEAKWQYPPIDVAPDHYYRFAATYRSDQAVDVVAEFELAGGGRTFLNLSTVRPAGQWTRVTEHLQVPAGATSLMLTFVSHGDGVTGVRDYELVDETQHGDVQWDRPLVSLTFDDGVQSVYDSAVPLLAEFGFAGTFYVTPATIETDGFLTARELQDLAASGHDVGVRGYDDVDLTGLGEDSLRGQLVRGRDAMAEAGLVADGLAPPLGRSDAEVEFHARKYFQTMRGMQPGLNTRQSYDPYDLKVFPVDSHTTPEALAAALTEAQESNGWLVLVYRQIAPERADDGDRSTITRDVFAAQLAMIRDSGIAVETVARAAAEVRAN